MWAARSNPCNHAERDARGTVIAHWQAAEPLDRYNFESLRSRNARKPRGGGAGHDR